MPVVGEAVAPEIRSEFECAVRTAYASTGPENFRALPVVRAFREKHPVSTATLYRWLDQLRASGVLGQETASGDANSADLLPSGRLDSAITVDMVGEKTILPAPPPSVRLSPDDPPATAGIAVVRNLEQIVAAALEVMQRSRKSLRDPDQAKLLLQSCELLRKSLETAIRLREQIWSVAKLDEFHRCIIQAVRRRCPAAANDIFEELERISETWARSGGNPAPS